jgi:hypothetical protein
MYVYAYFLDSDVPVVRRLCSAVGSTTEESNNEMNGHSHFILMNTKWISDNVPQL